MAPRTPAMIGTTSLSLERWPMTGEPKTRVGDKKKLEKKKKTLKVELSCTSRATRR